MADRVDDLDFTLVALLQEDGRRPTSEIARIVQVPESTVRRRIERLLRDGIISVVAVVEMPEMLDLPVHVSLYFKVAPSDQKEVLDELVDCDEIRWIALTTGPMNLASEGFFHSMDHLRTFIRDRIAAIPAIQDYRVDFILDLYKNRFDWAGMFSAGGGDGAAREGWRYDGRERLRSGAEGTDQRILEGRDDAP